MTEPTPQQLQEMMGKFGFTEQEARIAIHLENAEALLFELMEDDPGPELANIVWRETHVREHFNALHRQLGIRVLRRLYPKGWGYVPPENDQD